MNNLRFCIDTVEKRALNFCRGSMNTDDGFGSSALRRGHGNSDDFGCGYGFSDGAGSGGGDCYNDGDGDGAGSGDTRYAWGNNGNGWSADVW